MALHSPDYLWPRIVGRSAQDGDCLLWEGAANGRGYGQIGAGEKSKTVLVHRIAVLANGRTIPDGMTVDHLCRNRRCVNPDHLEVVTRGDNTRRGVAARALGKAPAPRVTSEFGGTSSAYHAAKREQSTTTRRDAA